MSNPTQTPAPISSTNVNAAKANGQSTSNSKTYIVFKLLACIFANAVIRLIWYILNINRPYTDESHKDWVCRCIFSLGVLLPLYIISAVASIQYTAIATCDSRANLNVCIYRAVFGGVLGIFVNSVILLAQDLVGGLGWYDRLFWCQVLFVPFAFCIALFGYGCDGLVRDRRARRAVVKEQPTNADFGCGVRSKETEVGAMV